MGIFMIGKHYSVYQYFANGAHTNYVNFVGIDEAMAAANFLINTGEANFGLTCTE
jgi:hypothetical protein